MGRTERLGETLGRGGGDDSGDGPIRGREEERRKEGREDEGGKGSVLHLGV